MASSLLEEFERQIEAVTLVPSSGGVFEVTAGDHLLFSKRATGRHPDYADVAEPVRALLG